MVAMQQNAFLLARTITISAMPPRSNEFQRLVYLVQHAFADGATVTESKMLVDLVSGEEREVDVVVEGTVGTQHVLVCLEVRHHKRRADITWIEQATMKHERLPTNALILVSRSGFTKNARAKAKSFGIQLLSYSEIETAEVGKLLGAESTLWFKSATVTVEKVRVYFPPIDSLGAETLVASMNNLLYNEAAEPVGQISALVEQAIRSEAAIKPLVEAAEEEHKWFELVWDVPYAPDGSRLCMMKLEPTKLRIAERIRIEGPCSVAICRFGMQQGRVGDLAFAWGSTKVAGKDAMLVATVLPSGAKTFTYSVK